MKILAISGSIRNGNTEILVDEAIRDIKTDKNVEIEKIHLGNIHMNYCSGCLKCDTTGNCIFDDDMTEIVSAVRASDAFIFATPTRWGLLSGELKTFLDRLNPLAIKEELKGKKAIVFAVGQSEEENCESIKYAAESLKIFCDNAGIEVIDTVIVCDCYDSNDASKKVNSIASCKNAINKLIINQ